MKKPLILTILTITILFLNAASVQPGICTQPGTTDSAALEHLCSLLKDAKPGDLFFCLGHIKKTDYSDREIANFILTWSRDEYRKQVPSVFRSKIDRIVKILATIDYQQLIIDIDFVKNSQLTVGEMVRLIKGTRLFKGG